VNSHYSIFPSPVEGSLTNHGLSQIVTAPQKSLWVRPTPVFTNQQLPVTERLDGRKRRGQLLLAVCEIRAVHSKATNGDDDDRSYRQRGCDVRIARGRLRNRPSLFTLPSDVLPVFLAGSSLYNYLRLVLGRSGNNITLLREISGQKGAIPKT
jgi:hypothetical protein